MTQTAHTSTSSARHCSQQHALRHVASRSARLTTATATPVAPRSRIQPPHSKAPVPFASLAAMYSQSGITPHVTPLSHRCMEKARTQGNLSASCRCHSVDRGRRGGRRCWGCSGEQQRTSRQRTPTSRERGGSTTSVLAPSKTQPHSTQHVPKPQPNQPTGSPTMTHHACCSAPLAHSR